MKKQHLNTISSIEVNNMNIKKIVMGNGNEYELLWDSDRVEEDTYHMIDLKKGWVKINKKFVSEELVIGTLKDKVLNPRIKSIIRGQYGEDIFLE